MIRKSDVDRLVAEAVAKVTADYEERMKSMAAEYEAKIAEIASKIVVGAKVVVRKKSDWRSEIAKTIEHVTEKNVLFKEDYGKRTKKDELISNILSNRWELLESN